MAKNPTDYKRQFNAEKYDRLYITVKKGKKAEIEALATTLGESLNSFVCTAIEEKMQKKNSGI